MNLLELNQQQAILALGARGWSRRRIARELGVHRITVGKYLRLAANTAKRIRSSMGNTSFQGIRPV